MRRFSKDERWGSRAARDRGTAPPLLSVEEQLDSVVLELMRPLDVDGTPVTEIALTAPTPDDILDAQARDGDSKEAQFRSLSRATKIPTSALRELHGRDFTRLSDLYWAFTE